MKSEYLSFFEVIALTVSLSLIFGEKYQQWYMEPSECDIFLCNNANSNFA